MDALINNDYDFLAKSRATGASLEEYYAEAQQRKLTGSNFQRLALLEEKVIPVLNRRRTMVQTISDEFENSARSVL